MSLELQAIGFKAETTDLERVLTVLDNIGNKGSDAGNRVAKSFASIRDAIKDVNRDKIDPGMQSAVDAAKAYVDQIDKAVKASNKLPKGLSTLNPSEGSTPGSGGTGSVSKSSVDMVEKLTLAMKILRNETIATAEGWIQFGEGFTKAQTNQLAFLTLMGRTNSDLNKAATAFEDYNRATGVNPFDKSTSGAYRLQKQLEELITVEKLQQDNLHLTRKEVVDYARDLEKLNQLEKSGVMNTGEVAKARAELANIYTKEAASLRQVEARAQAREQAAKAQGQAEIKKARDIADAQRYVTETLAKLDYQLEMVEEGFGKGAANAAYKFENALRQLGLSVSEQERILKKFGESQKQIAEKQKKDNIDYISRAVAPQITDVFVGLATGQAPLTILLQQGGQLRDMFGQMKVDSKDMAKVMTQSMFQMVDSIRGVGVAMVQLVATGFTSMAKAPAKFFAESITNVKASYIEMRLGAKAAQDYRNSLVGVGDAGPVIGTLSKLTGFLTGVIGSGVAAVGAFGIAYLVAFYKAEKITEELTKSLITTGASLGLTTKSAYALADSIQGITKIKGVEILTEMAKIGGFTSEQFKIAAKSISEFSYATGTSLTDIVKDYAKLKKDPVAALYELNSAMGTIPNASIAMVESLMRGGEAVKALELATKLLADGQRTAAQDIIGQWGMLATAWRETKRTFGDVGDWFVGLFAPTSTLNAYVESFKELQRLKKTGASTAEIDKAEAKKNKLEMDYRIEYQKSQNKARESELSGLNALNKSKVDALKAGVISTQMETAKEEKFRELYRARELTSDKRRYEVLKGNVADFKLFQQAEDDAWEKEKERRAKKTDGSLNKALQDKAKLIKEAYSNDLSTLMQAANTEQSILEKKYQSGMVSAQEYYTEYFVLLNKASADEIKLINETKSKAQGLKGKDRDSLLGKLDADAAKAGITAYMKYSEVITKATKPMEDFRKKLAEIRAEMQLDLQNQKDVDNLGLLKGVMSPEEYARQTAMLTKQQEGQRKIAEQKRQLDLAEENHATALNAQQEARNNPSISRSEYNKLSETTQKAADKVRMAKSELNDFEKELQNVVKITGDKAYFDAATSFFDEIQQKAQSINLGDSLASGFDKFSNSVADAITQIRKLEKFDVGYSAKKEKLLNDQSEALKSYGEKSVQYAKASFNLSKFEESSGQAKIHMYGEMAGAAKGYFAEHTAGYKVLDATQKVFQIMEIAQAAYTAAMAVQSGIRTAFWAVEAQVASLIAPPPFSFIALGAVTAILAALGVKALSGGGGGSFASTNTGTGTVKGDSSKQSESITKSIDLLKDIDTMTMKYSSKMLVALRQIESNTTGLADLLVSSGAIQASTSSYGIQTGFKQSGLGKTISGVFNVVDSVLSKVGLGGFVSAIGNVVGNLFGAKTSIKGQGFNIGGQSLGGILGGNLSSQYYTDVETKRKFLGITTGTSRDTYYSETDQLFKSQISLVFKGMADSIKAVAPALGISTSLVTDKLNNFVVDIGRVATDGLSQEDLQKRLTAVFSAFGDRLASSILPGFEKFQKVGEGYYETVVRVSSGVEQASGLLDNFGIAVININSVMNKQGDIAAEIVRDSILAKESLTGISDIISAVTGSASDIASAYSALLDVKSSLVAIGINANNTTSSLISGAGGLDNLTEAIDSYMQNFMTESERTAANTAKLQDKFKALGIVMPKTSADFVSLVKLLGQDTSEAGQKLLGKVLGLSDGFSQITTSINDAAEATKDFNKSIIDYVNSLGLSESGSSNSYATARAMFADQLGLARSGNSDARDSLTSYADKLLEAAKNQATSAVEYQTILGSVKAELLGLTTGTYAGTVLTSDVQSLNNSSVVSATNALAQETADAKEVMQKVLIKLTEMQAEDRAEGQSSVSSLKTITKIIQRADNGDSLNVKVLP